MEKIYLDNAATTKIDDRVISSMNDSFSLYGNPSSLHSFGMEARKEILNARGEIAEILNCESSEIVFTSGGSESDNLAIKGIVEATSEQKPHIITTEIEHHAVLNTIKDLEAQGKVDATYIKPLANGIVDAKAIKKAIKSNTVLVSVMYVNNETGCVQPIREISDIIKKHEGIYFHTDAVQAAGHLKLDVQKLGVDLLSITAHKFHGPKGVGLLYVKKGVKIKAQITGGEHELKRRAGTENISGIIGLKTALLNIDQKNDDKVKLLRNKLEDAILKKIPDSHLNGDKNDRVANISNISFKNAEGESIVMMLDEQDIAVATGSACTASTLEPSHVLIAMGRPEELTHGAIRFSLSKYNTEEEIEKVIKVLPGIIEQLRKMSPFQ